MHTLQVVSLLRGGWGGRSTAVLQQPTPLLPAAGWLAAGEVAHDYAVWMVSTAAGERNVAEKQAALLEAGALCSPHVWPVHDQPSPAAA